jgi:CBS domain containing-hemolysin-like protein
MVPRVKIDTLSSNTTVKEALEYYVKHTHSRIPIYTDTIDKIERFMTIRDILGENPNKKLSELELSKVLKIPSNKPISKLLTTFQKSTKHMAILIDEYGGVAGLITLEDVIEEIL